MKKVQLFVLALIITNFGYSQGVAKLNGKITNPTSEMVYLKEYIEENGRYKEVILDSFKLGDGGTFELKTEVTDPSDFSFFDGNEVCPVILSPGDDLYLTLNTKLFDETILYTGKGSDKNNAVKNVSLILEVILTKIRSFDDETDTTEIFTYMDKSLAEAAVVVKDYQNEIPDFKAYGDEQLVQMESMKKHFRKSIVSDRAFNALISSLTGTKGISVTGVNLKGKEINLEKFKGKTIVIDFWATWCGPCKAEMPAFKELEEKYGKDVNFVSLGLYCKKDAWKKMATDLGFENNMYLSKETQDQVKPWDVKFIPRYVVLDKDFKVVDAHAGRPSSGELESLILELNPNLK